MCGGIVTTKDERMGGDYEGWIIKPTVEKIDYAIEDCLTEYFCHTSSFFLRSGLVKAVEIDSIEGGAGDLKTIALHAVRGPIGYLHESVSVYRVNANGVYTGEVDVVKRAASQRKTLQSLDKHFAKRQHNLLVRWDYASSRNFCLESLRAGRWRTSWLVWREFASTNGCSCWGMVAALAGEIVRFQVKQLLSLMTQRLAVKTRLRRLFRRTRSVRPLN